MPANCGSDTIAPFHFVRGGALFRARRRAISCAPVSIRARFSRFVLLWPPAACKWGGDYFASYRAVESSNWRLAHKTFHTEDFLTP